MKSLFNSINKKVNKMLVDENSVLTRVSKKLEDKFLTIPISSEIMLKLINKQSIEGISKLEVGVLGAVPRRIKRYSAGGQAPFFSIPITDKLVKELAEYKVFVSNTFYNHLSIYL